jgi:ribosomal protein S18 acetylase RimI-like enzyme
MTEAALNVDTENEHGALGLHERCGFRPVSRRPMFSMTLEQGAGARTSSASFRPTSTPAAGGAVVLAAGLPRHPDAAAGRAG